MQYHAAGFKAAGGQLHAICDMNQEAAKSAANTYDVPNVFADSQKMLEELQDLDAVSIITPNRTHRPLALQALQAGKHVFCEKPPALNASEVKQMKEAAENAGKTLMFNFNNRARPESYALREYKMRERSEPSIPPRQNGSVVLAFPASEDGLPTRSFQVAVP